MLMVSLVGAVAALLGSLIGGLTSYAATNRQVEASSQQELDQFRREERKQIYFDYMAALDEHIMNTLEFESSARETFMPSTAEDLRRLSQKWGEKEQELFHLSVRINLLASDVVEEAAMQLQYKSGSLRDVIDEIVREKSSAQPNMSALEKAIDQLGKEGFNLQVMREAYMQSARDDLGLEN